MTDIVDELRRESSSLYYTDSVMRTVEYKMPDSLHLAAADEIERLRKIEAAAMDFTETNFAPDLYRALGVKQAE